VEEGEVIEGELFFPRVRGDYVLKSIAASSTDIATSGWARTQFGNPGTPSSGLIGSCGVSLCAEAAPTKARRAESSRRSGIIQK
jgi:hypothetical protein